MLDTKEHLKFLGRDEEEILSIQKEKEDLRKRGFEIDSNIAKEAYEWVEDFLYY